MQDHTQLMSKLLHDRFYADLLSEYIKSGQDTVPIKNPQTIGLHHFVTNEDIIMHLEIYLGLAEIIPMYVYPDVDGNKYYIYSKE